jgi:hypothetical protein
MTFAKVYPNGSGRLLGVDLLPISAETSFTGVQTLPYLHFHEKLGHPNAQVVTATAKSFGVLLTGIPKPCISCAIGKSKRKKINKISTTQATTKGERLAIDLSWVNHHCFGGSQY